MLVMRGYFVTKMRTMAEIGVEVHAMTELFIMLLYYKDP